MTLSTEDGQLFYKLWLPLLDYVNKKNHINKKLKNMATAKSLDPADVKEIANVLWDNVDLIDDYIKEKSDIPTDQQEILKSWKRRVQGRFMLERHLKKGTILISMEDEAVYQSVGIISSWEEMFFGAPMPLMIYATLLPFKDVIISDGLIMPYNVIIGGGMKKAFKDVYMKAKKEGRIISTL